MFGCAPVKASTSTLPSTLMILLLQPMTSMALSTTQKRSQVQAQGHWTIGVPLRLYI
jgi:hypothetical protein